MHVKDIANLFNLIPSTMVTVKPPLHPLKSQIFSCCVSSHYRLPSISIPILIYLCHQWQEGYVLGAVCLSVCLFVVCQLAGVHKSYQVDFQATW